MIPAGPSADTPTGPSPAVRSDPSPGVLTGPSTDIPIDLLGRAWALASLEPAAVRHFGQIFTPPAVVRLMLDLVGLEPGADAAVLDPACGSGALLLGAGARVGRQGRLHGIERDEGVAGLALENLRGARAPATLEGGDALVMRESLRGRFDVVVSNPPYVAWHRIESTVRPLLEAGPFLGCDLRGRPNHRDQQPNLGLFFLLLGLHALRPGGRLVYLLPPEWLTSERVAALRARLVEDATLLHLLRFDAGLHLFAGAGAGGARVQTGSMILVAEKGPPPSGHRLTVTEVTAFAPDDVDHARLLADWLLERRRDPGPVVAERRSVGQSTLSAARWELSGDERHALSGIPLIDVPGVRVVGGHQPPVAWLDWLELDRADLETLPDAERRWLAPAVRESRGIMFPVLPPPSRWWVFLPRGLDESAAFALAPALMRRMRARTPVDPPSRWWEFPNPRNLELVMRPGPRLLAPRTAANLRVSWDAAGHHIKGTNTLITVESGASISLGALFGLLNSEPLRRWASRYGRPYHGNGILQEPREIARLPIPLPETPRLRALFARLEAIALQVPAGKNDWASIHSIASDLYM